MADFSEDTTRFRGPLEADELSGWEGMPSDLISRRDKAVEFIDFTKADDLNTTDNWVEKDIGTQTLNPTSFIVDNLGEGILAIDSDATDGDGVTLQYRGANGSGLGITFSDGATVFVARITHEDWDAHHWFVGLASTVAAFNCVDADGDITCNHAIGFHHNADDNGDGLPRLTVRSGAVTTQHAFTRTPAAPVDDTYRILSFRMDTTSTANTYSIRAWVDGILVCSTSSAISQTGAAGLTLSNVMNTASGDQLRVDYVGLSTTR